jgi:hypothetical protein
VAQRRTSEAPLEVPEARELIARFNGFPNWATLLDSMGASKHERAAEDFVSAFDGDAAALARLNEYYGRAFTVADVQAEVWRRLYSYRQRAHAAGKSHLTPDEAQLVVAQDAGYGSWDALMQGAPAVAPYVIDSKENRISPRRRLEDAEWDDLIAVIRERRITGVDAGGLMTDRAMARIAEIDHVTSLNLGGSRELSDDGLLELAKMPQLERLNLSEYPGGKLTDRGLEALRHLPNLREFEMTWQAGITDKGAANLRYCEQIERVDLMGSPTGDGAIEALQGKAKLRRFSTGRLVTDAGLPLLHHFPMLKRWHGEDAGGTLLIDGPFTDAGLSGLAGLEGVADLDLFWHVSGVTPDGFAALVRLPNLMSLGCDGDLSGDGAMPHIAAIPRLRKLRAQESVATEEGFVALARSKTLEGFWGRVCPNFASRSFLAFSKMPALRTLGVGLANVGDEALAALPDFPALRELTPIGLKDDGFRHVGRCVKLERLTCMYCRESGDAATEHIAGLSLNYYYAGLTQITDRSLEILGRMESLEKVELYECKGVTDAGLPFLARLPRLSEVHLDGLPGVTLDGTKIFPERVRVLYST